MNRDTLIKDIIKNFNSENIVEIGTWRGDFADFLLSNSKNTTLYAIDPYLKYDDFVDSCNDYVDDDFYNSVKNRLELKFGDRIKMIRKNSFDAVNDIPNDIEIISV